MPFRYRLQKILDFRIRKKEEQLLVVQKAQQEVFIAEENIRKNNEEIKATQLNMRKADPMMYDTYDKYLIHLWEKAEQLELIRQEKQAILARKFFSCFFYLLYRIPKNAAVQTAKAKIPIRVL